MKKNKDGFWTPEKVIEEAKKYETKGQFCVNSSGAYDAAKRFGIMKIATKNMIVGPKRKWNESTLTEEAAKYQNKTEFRNKFSWAVTVAKELGIYDKITSHMDRRGGWTKEEVKLEASKYRRRVDFKRGNEKLWQFASKRPYYEEICSHMTRVGNFKKRLVYLYVFHNSTIYVGLTDDFEIRNIGHGISGSVFNYKQITGEIPEVKILTDYIDAEEARKLERQLIQEYKDKGWRVLNRTKGGELGGMEEFWTKEKIMELSINYKHRWEFGQNHSVPYRKACIEKWEEVFSHMEDKLIDWDEEKIINTAKESGLTIITEFAKKYSGAYHAAERLGIKQKLRDVFEWKGGKEWTFDEVKEIASKYTTRSKFDKENHNACVYSQKKGWYNEIVSHMGYLPKGKKWTKEEVHEEAKKYTTRTKFSKGSNKQYQSASHNGWLDEVCSHMFVAKGGKIGKRLNKDVI